MLRNKHNNASGQSDSVPLKRVVVDARLRTFAADVTIQQVFRNDESTSIEAVYCFPIEEQAAIYAFVARIGDREIVAQLKEKEEAQKQYTDALRQGHGAYLLEQDEKSQDNFIINVGALPAGEECRISISYVTELDLIETWTKDSFCCSNDDCTAIQSGERRSHGTCEYQLEVCSNQSLHHRIPLSSGETRGERSQFDLASDQC